MIPSLGNVYHTTKSWSTFAKIKERNLTPPNLTVENPVRLSSSLLVNRDPLDLSGDVTHFFVLPTSHTLASALAIVTIRTDEFGERKSSLAIWEISKSTSALHATFSQLSQVSNIPPPKDEAVWPENYLC